MEEDLSEKQAEEIIRGFSEGKSNLHTFFTKIIKNPDTTRVGNLNEEELGHSLVPVRTYKELALFSKDIANQTEWGNYFEAMSQIQTSTSLSKDALLIKLSVTQKKELADVTPKRKSNTGWFKKKNPEGSE